MSTKSYCIWVIVCVMLLSFVGCKKKGSGAGNGQTVTVSAEEISAVRDMLARGMQKIAFDELGASHTGKKCVVTAQMPAGGYKPTPPPPPPGMVRLVGQAIIYNGELAEVSAESITVRAAYPTPGNYKRIEVPRDDIQSIHLAQ